MSILGLLLTTSPSVADGLTAINRSGDTLLTAVWKKREVAVTIRTTNRHGESPSSRSNDRAIAVIRELSILLMVTKSLFRVQCSPI